MALRALGLLLAASATASAQAFGRSSALSSIEDYYTATATGYNAYSYTYGATAATTDTLPTAVGPPGEILTPSASVRASASPCAGVSAAVSEWSYAGSRPTARPLIEAELAYNCLQEVPVRSSDAGDLVDYVLASLEFQSNLDYLKSPPDSYKPGNPPIDLVAELNGIRSRVQSNDYKSQYDLENAISETLASAYDGHLGFSGYTNQLAFGWIRDPRLTLASVVQGQDSTPNVYLVADLNKTGDAASPVAQVNGQDAADFFSREADKQSLHDPDARWNSMFFSQAGGPSFGFFILPSAYPGPDTTVVLQNGTRLSYPNLAEVFFPSDWMLINSGDDFYEYALEPSDSSYSSASTDASSEPKDGGKARKKGLPSGFPLKGVPRKTSPVSPQDNGHLAKRDVPNGYPEPYITQSLSDEEVIYLSGYFEPYEGVENGLAILALQSFLASEDEPFLDFQDTVATFLSEARRRGTKKIIIDVSSNGGGTALLAFEVFRQFFPDLGFTTNARFRATEPLNSIGSVVSSLYGYSGAVFSKYSWTEQDGTLFSTWSNLYGPQEFGNGQYSSALQWDICDATYRHNAPSGYQATGCPDSPSAERPFASSDITILTNGICASACALFKEFMSTQGNVTAFALGDRQQDGPMQAIGGTRGGVVLSLTQIDAYVSLYDRYGPSSPSSASVGLPQELPIYAYLSVNSQNEYRPDLDVPLQFVEDLAGCRLYETAAMSLDVREIWSAVAAAAWGGAGGGIDSSKCVSGSAVNEEAKGSAVDSANANSYGSGGGGGGGGSAASGLFARPWLALAVAAVLSGGLCLL